MHNKILLGGKPINISNSDYKGAGGEGSIFVKNGLALKIYHDAKKAIPKGKIDELNQLKIKNVLAPIEPIFDVGGSYIGFAMPYVDNTEFLCKLFVSTFRNKNSISPEDIKHMVWRMQETLQKIHDKNILAVDLNELNFLASKKWNEVFFIDVDSYQTPHYHATAIMDSIRDRQVKNNQFTKESDWFSWAVVTFQLYMGAHPFKGRHPDYNPKDWLTMMDKGISVYHPKCKLPPNCQDWSVIPKGHARYFEDIFKDGQRKAPPTPDDIILSVGAITPKVIIGTDKFEITEVFNATAAVEHFQLLGGLWYIVSKDGIYKLNKKVSSFTGATAHSRFLQLPGREPQLVDEIPGLNTASFEKGYFIQHDRLYTIVGDKMVEFTFSCFNGKVVVSQRVVSTVIGNSQLFEGMIVQDLLGTCHFNVPLKPGTCSIIRIPELDKMRIIEAKYQSGFAVVIAENKGKYERHVFQFKNHEKISSRKEENVALQSANFVVMDNGVCIATNDDTIEVFRDNAQIKVIDNSPLANNEELHTYGNQVFAAHGKKIYQIKLK